MGYPPSKNLIDQSWPVGRTLVRLIGTGNDFTIVGKENGELQLCEKISDKNNKVEYIVKSYKPEKILIHDSGGPIENAVPEREITRISKDEYYKRVKPSSELNKKYLKILNLLY